MWDSPHAIQVVLVYSVSTVWNRTVLTTRSSPGFVDVFQAWCGPCKPVVNLFQKIKNEVGSNLLHFAVAEVDSIDALEKYRGQCEPVFLFYTVSENTFPVPSGSACCFCRTSLLSQTALLHPETDEETQSRLFQGFPLAVEQSSSEGRSVLMMWVMCSD
uniref:Thioredoxin domain-containing protein n=1 Tax=Taeniopygia guttata TaxID=59729 RepID=H0Z9I5_TAEGU